MLPRLPGESRLDWIARNQIWARTPEGRAELAADAGARRRPVELDVAWLIEAGAPESLARSVCQELQDTAALARVREKCAQLQVLFGGAGTGKSTAACWWLRGIRDVVYVRAAALARVDWYDEGVVEGMMQAERVVIDDLGDEYLDKGGNYQARLSELVCGRFDEGLPTVITTNVPVRDFEQRYQVRIWDRIKGPRGSFFAVGKLSMRKKGGG